MKHKFIDLTDLCMFINLDFYFGFSENINWSINNTGSSKIRI